MINASNIKYWHTVTLKNGVGSYEAPLINGVPLAELRRHHDGKTFIYHVPADDIAASEAALDCLFNA